VRPDSPFALDDMNPFIVFFVVVVLCIPMHFL